MDSKTRRVLITIYDLRNKFITMSYLLPAGENIKTVLQDGGVSYVITSSGCIIRFQEKDASSKIDVLLKKSLHTLALALAAEEQLPPNEIMKLYKTYGDHLFKRGDLEAAITQYSNTIGFVPASYVIRRFLDSQKVSHLTSYLEALHKKGFASKDLTTLLLTCYTKTRDVEHLDNFIGDEGTLVIGNAISDAKSSTLMGSGTDKQSNTMAMSLDSAKFDVNAAINTLRQAGYLNHAIKLALRYEDHDGYLSMILDSNSVENPPDGATAFTHLVALVSDCLKAVRNDIIAEGRSSGKLWSDFVMNALILCFVLHIIYMISVVLCVVMFIA